MEITNGYFQFTLCFLICMFNCWLYFVSKKPHPSKIGTFMLITLAGAASFSFLVWLWVISDYLKAFHTPVSTLLLYRHTEEKNKYLRNTLKLSEPLKVPAMGGFQDGWDGFWCLNLSDRAVAKSCKTARWNAAIAVEASLFQDERVDGQSL